MTDGGARNSALSAHTRRRITASSRATATLAFLCPIRFARRPPHSFKVEAFWTRDSSVAAASTYASQQGVTAFRHAPRHIHRPLLVAPWVSARDRRRRWPSAQPGRIVDGGDERRRGDGANAGEWTSLLFSTGPAISRAWVSSSLSRRATGAARAARAANSTSAVVVQRTITRGERTCVHGRQTSLHRPPR